MLLTFDDNNSYNRSENCDILCAMSKEDIDMASKELWERAKAIFILTLQSENEKQQANRYFGMITSVTARDNRFIIYTINQFAADLMQKDYAN